MTEKVLEYLSEGINCYYTQEDTEYITSAGDIFTKTEHRLDIHYKNSLIHAYFELGRKNIASIQTSILNTKYKDNFEVMAYSHLTRLFFRKKSPWNIKTSSATLKQELQFF